MIIKQPCTLLMFSGGLDSLAALHLLRSQGEHVHVHHMHLHNAEGRAPAEQRAVEAIRAYYDQTGRPLEYSESSFQYPSINGQFFYDTEVYKFMAGYIASRAPAVKAVAIGRNLDDGFSPAFEARVASGNKALRAFTDVPVVYPVGHLTKRQCSALLPPELRALAWSCRRPVYLHDETRACGKCKTCKALANIT